jgi:hypothetical protein
MGFGLDSDAIHSPNEHFGIFNYLKESKPFRCFTNICGVIKINSFPLILNPQGGFFLYPAENGRSGCPFSIF